MSRSSVNRLPCSLVLQASGTIEADIFEASFMFTHQYQFIELLIYKYNSDLMHMQW